MNRFKSEAKRYDVIEFYIKSELVCKSCLNIVLDGYNWHSIGITNVDQWEKITINLKDLDLPNDATYIESFMFQGASPESKNIYFDQIKLVKSNYVDNGQCADNSINDSKDNSFSYFVKVSYFSS